MERTLSGLEIEMDECQQTRDEDRPCLGRAVHPGEVIVEMREEAGMKQVHLAGAARISAKHLCQIEKGLKPLSARVAVEIEIALGKRCAVTLMAMQGYYDVHAERVAQRGRLAAISSLLEDS